ncbi:hypothetical protein ACG74X_08500 [Marivita sp. S0852]|uniref:hypothetical protein n=1 Tax=Marivita sp. S0852 TaxID=3373893 RepID=UPI003982580A
MKQFVAALIVTLAAAPALSEEGSDSEEGSNLMEQGAELFFRGLMDELDPALEQLEGLADEIGPVLREFADDLGPALRSLQDEVEDWSAYEPPIILPNGDILIKRKPETPTPDAVPAPDAETDEIEI